jgi:phenylacetate-coenzyme A ligase PaaK-like adenylate-forming protein
MTEPGHRPYSEQLNDTLRFAVENIPWYRDQADVYRGPLFTPQDLARLPIIDRATVMADQRAFASSDALPSVISYSSSTTGGIGQPRWRSEAEQLALASFLASARDTVRRRDVHHTDGITLVIHPFDQGPPFEGMNETRRLYVGMFVPWHFELIKQILTDGWESPAGRLRITTIDCFSPGLRILTEWFDQRGIDPREFGVEMLIGYGSLQPARWRRRLSEVWGAGYCDLYGLSEVILSESAQCPLCEAYHFTFPIVPEVVDLVTRQPMTAGVGALLLTELYPYAQLQLFMRYWTDDIVELVPPCPLGGLGIKFRGRHTSSVIIGRGGRTPLVVGSVQVGSICADFADVAVSEIPWATWAHDVGTPRFSLSADDRQVRITVELRYSPSLFPERAALVADELDAVLRREISSLAQGIDDGEIDLLVTCVGAGQIPDAVKV